MFDSKKQEKSWTLSKAQTKAGEVWSEIEKKGIPDDMRKGLDTDNYAEVVMGKKKHKFRSAASVKFVRKILTSSAFNTFIISTIIANTVTIALEAEHQANSPLIGASDLPIEFEYLDLVYLVIYSLEFLLKIYASPRGYWRSNYNRFDFIILCMSYFQWFLNLIGAHLVNLTFLRIVRSLRALRAFRSVSFIRALQIIVNALLATIKKDVVNLLLLMGLIMFILSIMGHYLFGEDTTKVQSRAMFGNLPLSMRTFWIFSVADGWTSYQTKLIKEGYVGSQAFSVFVVFFGNIVWQNLFVGVIAQNIQSASDADKNSQMEKRRRAKIVKREMFLKKQRGDMSQLLAHQRADRTRSMQEVLAKLAGSLRHDDILPTNHLSCNVMWMDTYLISLHYHENTMYRVQQTHFHIANTLAELVDRKLKSRYKVEK